MARRKKGSILHFSCEWCGTHLGFDDSLAGLQAPCPKCGSLVKAPELESPSLSIPSSGVTRGISADGGLRSGMGRREAVRGASGREKRRGGRVYPANGPMPIEDEKANMGALIRILVATFLVVIVVALVVWCLRDE